MKSLKKAAFTLAALIVLFWALSFILNSRIHGKEGLFKIGSCVRDDEMGVTYKIKGLIKGMTSAEVLVSDKYPSSETYKVGYQKLIRSNENPQKMYSIPCPQ